MHQLVTSYAAQPLTRAARPLLPPPSAFPAVPVAPLGRSAVVLLVTHRRPSRVDAAERECITHARDAHYTAAAGGSPCVGCWDVLDPPQLVGAGTPRRWRSWRCCAPSTEEARVTSYGQGLYYEKRTAAALRKDGYLVLESRGSHGCADLVALKRGQQLLVQVKKGTTALKDAEWNELTGRRPPPGALAPRRLSKRRAAAGDHRAARAPIPALARRRTTTDDAKDGAR